MCYKAYRHVSGVVLFFLFLKATNQATTTHLGVCGLAVTEDSPEKVDTKPLD
tara:strand:+ start:2609 stop:2764 length:156 start_codon:yes stop_codon:yes gene_type:complete